MRSIVRALYRRSLLSSYAIAPTCTKSPSFISQQLSFCTESDSERFAVESGTDSDTDGHDLGLFLRRLQGVPRDLSLVPVLQGWIEAGNKLGPIEMKTVFGKLEWKKKFAQALEVVEWLLKERPFELVEHHYARWLTYLGKVHGHEKVKSAFAVIPPEFQKEVVYCKLFDVYLQHDRVSEALGIMRWLMNQKMQVPVYMCNNLISYCDKHLMHNKIPALLRLMDKKKISYSLHTYNILLTNCSTNADIERMEQIWDHLQSDMSVKPDFVSYVTLASAYLFAGQHEKALSATVKAEKDLTERITTILRLKKLIALYGLLQQGEDVGRIYEKLKTMPGSTSVPSYLCVMEAYGDAGLLDSAEKVMEEMKLEKGLIHRDQYNAILGVYCKNGKMEKAEVVLEKLSAAKHKPDMMTFSYLLLGYLKSNQVKKAMVRFKSILTLAGDEDDTPNRKVFISRTWLLNMSSVMGLLAEKDDEKHANALLTVLQKAKLEKFPRSYHFIRQAYERSFGCASVSLAEE